MLTVLPTATLFTLAFAELAASDPWTHDSVKCLDCRDLPRQREAGFYQEFCARRRFSEVVVDSATHELARRYIEGEIPEADFELYRDALYVDRYLYSPLFPDYRPNSHVWDPDGPCPF